jgi:flagellar biosynthesis protein
MTEKPSVPIAVAIGQQGDKTSLPMVMASGKGFWAEQMLALAFAQGIPVREDADLAQMLSIFDTDTPIPVEAFGAIAEILAYVYRANAAFHQRKP